LGRGFLTGQLKSVKDLPTDSALRHFPRFQPDVFGYNLQLVTEVEKLAKRKGCTPAQLALSWIKTLSKSAGNPEIIPIPGATTRERVVENSTEMMLSAAEFEEIQTILDKFNVKGARYGGPGAVFCEG